MKCCSRSDDTLQSPMFVHARTRFEAGEIQTCLHMTFRLHACSATSQSMLGYPPAGVKVSGSETHKRTTYIYIYICIYI